MNIQAAELRKFIETIERKNLSVTDVIDLIDNKIVNIHESQEFIEEDFILEVDYTKSLSAMVKAGKYDFVNSSFLENDFGVSDIFSGKKINIKVKTVNFKKKIGKEKAKEEISKRGLLFASLPELLAFGEQYPELQIHHDIVCINSEFNKFCDFRNKPMPNSPSLSFSEKGRTLSLIIFNYFTYKDKILCIKK